MPRKPNNATSVTDVIYDTFAQMQRWGAPVDAERITDSTIMVAFSDGTAAVQIKVTRKELKNDRSNN